MPPNEKGARQGALIDQQQLVRQAQDLSKPSGGVDGELITRAQIEAGLDHIKRVLDRFYGGIAPTRGDLLSAYNAVRILRRVG